MPTLTIPKKMIQNDDLVVLPRKEYEALIRAKNGQKKSIVVKRSPSFRVAKKHEPFYDALDKELTEALREVAEGKGYGPFDTVDELFKHLDRKR